MNTAGGFVLFLLGAFALVVLFLRFPSIQYYTGAGFILLFMAGVFYIWANTIRQTRKFDEKQSEERKTASSEPQPNIAQH
jgi:protein-S-isoprenylcysteine O-methyltransferase Ste14